MYADPLLRYTRAASPDELLDITNLIQQVIEEKARTEIEHDSPLWIEYLLEIQDVGDMARLLSAVVKSSGEYQQMEAVEQIKALRESYVQWRYEHARNTSEWGRIEEDLRA